MLKVLSGLGAVGLDSSYSPPPLPVATSSLWTSDHEMDNRVRAARTLPGRGQDGGAAGPQSTPATDGGVGRGLTDAQMEDNARGHLDDCRLCLIEIRAQRRLDLSCGTMWSDLSEAARVRGPQELLRPLPPLADPDPIIPDEVLSFISLSL